MTVMAVARRVAAAVVLVLVGGRLLAAQAMTQQSLYLLAGTPGTGDFALEMFSVSAGGIAHVREVIAPPESGGQLCAGFLAAFDDEQGHIFVVSPADPGICPPAITVLHENDPGRVDMISGFIAPVPARAGHRIFSHSLISP